MPDDSSPDFRAAQQAHAAKIKAERAVMEMTGLNRSQIRSGLRSFQQRTQQPGFTPSPVANTAPVPLPQTPQGKGSKFDVVPFSRQAEEGGTPKGVIPPTDITDVIVISNGTAYHATLTGTLGTAL